MNKKKKKSGTGAGHREEEAKRRRPIAGCDQQRSDTKRTARRGKTPVISLNKYSMAGCCTSRSPLFKPRRKRGC